MATMLSSIEKLKGRENYNTWAFAVKAYLEHEDLWSCVLGDDQTQDDGQKAKRETRARSKLVMLVDPINYVHINDATTTIEVWTKLKNAFQDNGLSRKVSLIKKMITTKLEDCPSMEVYVQTILSTAHMLNNIKFEINEEWLGTFLLAGLPERFQPMIMAIENSGAEITGDFVKTKLLQEIKFTTGNCVNNAALLSHANNKYDKKKFDKKKKFKCYNCNQFGHFADKCPKTNKKFNNHNDRTMYTNFSANELSSSDDWYIDSGASSHMTHDFNNLCNVKDVINEKFVIMANNQKIEVKNSGDYKLTLLVNNKDCAVTIKNVLYVPDLSTNLISVSQLINNGKSVVFKKSNCCIYENNGELLATATLHNNMFKLNTKKETSFMMVSDKDLWHRRLGHMNYSYMKKLRHIVGANFINSDNMEKCIVCLKGKQAKAKFESSVTSTSMKLELIHADLCGPMEETSLGGSRYFFTLIDDFTHKVFVYFLRNKNEVTDVFKHFKSQIEKESGQQIKTFRTDNGGEFCNDRLKDFLRAQGIRHQTTIPYNPQQNGLAERMNRSIVEKARCLLIDANLNKKFWAEAVNTSVYLINRSPTAALSNMVPEGAWTNKKVDLFNLKVFGSKVMVHIPKAKRRKFDPKSEENIFVGYCENQKGYRVYNVVTKKVTSTRDAIFIENAGIMNNDIDFMSSSVNSEQDIVSVIPNEVEDMSDEELITSNGYFDDIVQNNNEHMPDINLHNDEYEVIEPRRSERIPKPNRMNDFVYSVNNLKDPDTFDEAIKSIDSNCWIKAMNDELKSLRQNDTWTLVELPMSVRPIQSKWVYKTKVNSDGTIGYKARLVIKGCAQRKGIDYEETYAPVVKYNTIRYLMAMAAQYDMDIEHMDAVSAFLQGELNECIYMSYPDVPGISNNDGKVCKLNKSIYGLKQASRIWNIKLDGVLTSIGMTRSKVDRCVFYNCKGNKKLFIAVYVDDILIFSNDKHQIKQLKLKLQENFDMKDLGPVRKCLGFNVTRDRANGTLWLDQSDYIQRIIQRFGMQNCNVVTTPIDINVKLNKDMSPKCNDEINEMRDVPYQEAVGSLLYAAQGTRPDIAFAVNVASRYNNNPGKQHWNAVKRIFSYLKGTSDFKLRYVSSKNSKMIGFSDADWASDTDERKSTTGYVFMKSGGAITWGCRKQQTVALSTTEAEYMALSAATQEAMWLRNLNVELLNEDSSMSIFCDSQSAISLACTDIYHPRSKHIDVRHHYIREKLATGEIAVTAVASECMVADILTKGLPRPKHVQHCKDLELSSSGSVEV